MYAENIVERCQEVGEKVWMRIASKVDKSSKS